MGERIKTNLKKEEGKNLSKDPKGGSDPKSGGNPPPSTPTKMSIDEALAENEILKQQITEKDSTIADLTAQLKEANDVLEAQTKAKMISEILPRSNFTIEDLTAKSLDELQHIRATLDQAKLPTYKNIRGFGPIGSDEQKNEGLTVGDLSVVTEAKRKAGRA